uniref:Disease resistance protein At1g63350 n=1 Tax=Nicotiana tabacum TaxID=4097 RepID=A0A1S4D2E1_TOBAC|nr:PREDICTED: putative disease resistance protein At1g63350 [Nicotiana tabacum]
MSDDQLMDKSYKALFRSETLRLDDSWKLLYNRLFGAAHDNCPSELEEIGKQIVGKCQGLPLAILVVAGHLSKVPMTEESWESVAKNVSKVITSYPDKCLAVLAMSYHHLPIHLKPCFLHLGIFPEDCEITIERLIRLWVSEGFLKCDRLKSLEEVAEDCLEDLPIFGAESISFPPSLKKLSLIRTRLPWDDMAILAKLPNLEVLKLSWNAFRGEVWELNDEHQFISYFIRHSHIGGTNLQCLVLSEIGVQLKGIPLSFVDICSLESIELYQCYGRHLQWQDAFMSASMKDSNSRETSGLEFFPLYCGRYKKQHAKSSIKPSENTNLPDEELLEAVKH